MNARHAGPPVSDALGRVDDVPSPDGQPQATPAHDDDVAPGDGRNETPNERSDRNWSDILQELRVALTGTQLIGGFLLAVAFQPRFEELDRYQLVLYLVLVALAGLATIVGLAPVTLHRTLFRHQVKERIVRTGNGCSRPPRRRRPARARGHEPDLRLRRLARPRASSPSSSAPSCSCCSGSCCRACRRPRTATTPRWCGRRRRPRPRTRARVSARRHRLAPCASPPGTSTRSAPASAASSTGWCAKTSTCSRCRRSSASPSSSRSSSSRRRATSSPSTASTSGTASPSRAARRSSRGRDELPGHAGLPQGPSRAPTSRRRRARSARPSTACGCGASTCPTAARSATRTTPTSSTGSRRSPSTRAPRHPRRPRGAVRAHGRLQHRPVRRRQRRPDRRRGPHDARLARRSARRSSRLEKAGVTRRRAPARARGLHLLGLQAAAVPPQRGHAHRLHPRLDGVRRRGDGCLDPPQRAQGRRRRATTCPCSSTSRSAGRRRRCR